MDRVPEALAELIALAPPPQRPAVEGLDSELECYEYAKARFPGDCPFPTFPEPGGLLPLGGDTNGGRAFWLTEGPPESWPLILYPHGFAEHERHDLPLVRFLVRWLSGVLPGCFFGVGGDFLGRTDPVFQ